MVINLAMGGSSAATAEATDETSSQPATQPAETQPEPTPTSEPQPEPEPEPTPEPPAEPMSETSPEPVPEPIPEPTPPEPVEAAATPREHRTTPPAPPQTTPLATNTSATSTSASASTSAGARHAEQSWQQQLLAHLQRYKRYPRLARSRQITGTVYLSFATDRSGTVLQPTISQSSGSNLLDNAGLQMLQRAEPLPPPPPELPPSMLSLQVPVRFTLN